MRQDGRLIEVDWPTAMIRVVEVSRRLLAEKGPLSHGFYTSGQLFLEEHYTLGVLGKAGLGRPTWTATPGSVRRPPRRR